MSTGEKTFKIVDGDISDGYHTFDELYEHRCLLYIALVQRLSKENHVYWVREHYEGWDILVAEIFEKQTPEQPYMHGQISYHVPVKFRPYYRRFLERDIGDHAYDGHTSKDVLTRLEALVS